MFWSLNCPGALVMKQKYDLSRPSMCVYPWVDSYKVMAKMPQRNILRRVWTPLYSFGNKTLLLEFPKTTACNV